MASPSQITAANKAPDRLERIRLMARTMRDRADADGACTMSHLYAAGFTQAEIEAYRDQARGLLSGRRPLSSPARMEGERLVRMAKLVRRRIRDRRTRAVQAAQALAS